MIETSSFIKSFPGLFEKYSSLAPWQITGSLQNILIEIIAELDDVFVIKDGIAIHKTAVIESGVVLKAPAIICEQCFLGSNAYLRGGVYLDNNVKIGTGCEIKTSIIFSNSAIAHFNFIGDSIIGSNVNFEAGAITANHFNERENKNIEVVYNSEIIHSGVQKFGSLIGDGAKIGANAVLSPGSVLFPGTVVKRLELVDQVEDLNFGRR